MKLSDKTEQIIEDLFVVEQQKSIQERLEKV